MGGTDLKPHKNVCWLNADIDDQEIFEQKVGKICETYLNAEENERKGIHTISVDEKAEIQALERDAPTQPMRPGQPERMTY